MWHRLVFWIRNQFGFSRSEASGVLILFLIMAISLSAPALLDSFWPSDRLDETNKAYLDSLVGEIRVSIPSRGHVGSPKYRATSQPEAFDPNTAGLDDLIKAGIPSYMARRMVNYRSKGGKFRKPEDVARISGATADLFSKIKPFIRIDTMALAPKPWPGVIPGKDSDEDVVFNVNELDSAALDGLKGVSAYTASKVVRYRDALGGFVSKNQLYEVWGLDTARANILASLVYIDTGLIVKINLNQDSVERIAKHPYIGWKRAKLIVGYRNQHGPFEYPQAILRIHALNEEWLFRMLPYLEL